MKPAPLSYVRPSSLEQAVTLLAANDGNARILAGGQSLMPMLAFRLAQPALLVDINRIPGADAITCDTQGVQVGPSVRHADLLRHAQAGGHPLLAAALPLVAHSGVRNRGTVCGSLALADPAAELPACAIALDARLKLLSVRGPRWVEADAFFRGIYDTDLAEDEMIAAVVFPHAAAGWRWTCQEVARRHGDFAMAGLAAGLRRDGARITEARLVAFGVGERPLRLHAAEQALCDGVSLDGVTDAVASLDQEDISGTPDYPAPYRRDLLATLLRRSVAALTDEGTA